MDRNLPRLEVYGRWRHPFRRMASSSIYFYNQVGTNGDTYKKFHWNLSTGSANTAIQSWWKMVNYQKLNFYASAHRVGEALCSRVVRFSVSSFLRFFVFSFVTTSCLRDISYIAEGIFTKFDGSVHCGMYMNWLNFGGQRAKVKVKQTFSLINQLRHATVDILNVPMIKRKP